ncbi:replication initiation factor domain protein, partial [Neisseria gonorrhoeae]
MGDKQGMTKAVAGVMTEAPADGRKPATASNLPPLSNRGGTETETAGRVQEVFECYETYITDGKGNLAISFEKPEYCDFSGSTATAFTFALSAKIT